MYPDWGLRLRGCLCLCHWQWDLRVPELSLFDQPPLTPLKRPCCGITCMRVRRHRHMSSRHHRQYLPLIFAIVYPSIGERACRGSQSRLRVFEEEPGSAVGRHGPHALVYEERVRVAESHQRFGRWAVATTRTSSRISVPPQLPASPPY
jgi:hypothetical protein